MKKLFAIILIVGMWCGSAWGATIKVGVSTGGGAAGECEGADDCDYTTLSLALANAATADNDTIVIYSNLAETATPTLADTNIIIRSNNTTHRVITAAVDNNALNTGGYTVSTDYIDFTTSTNGYGVYVTGNGTATVSSTVTINHSNLINNSTTNLNNASIYAPANVATGPVTISIANSSFTHLTPTNLGNRFLATFAKADNTVVVNNCYFHAGEGVADPGNKKVQCVAIQGGVATISNSYFEIDTATGSTTGSSGILASTVTAEIARCLFKITSAASNNSQGIAVQSDNGTMIITCYGNIFSGVDTNASWGIYAADSYAGDLNIYNNTFYGLTGGLRMLSDYTAITHKNNLYDSNTHDINVGDAAANWTTDVTSLNNNYFGEGTAISDHADVVTAEGAVASNTELDPNFLETTITDVGYLSLSATSDASLKTNNADLTTAYAGLLAQNTLYHTTLASQYVNTVSADTLGWPKGAYAYQTEFYVDSVNGTAHATGMSANPLLTLAETATLAVKTGDDVYLKDGSTFTEQWTQTASGVDANNVCYLKSYPGTGTKPVIDGSDVITGFAGPDGNGEYTVAMTTEPKQVFVDGTRWTLGTVTTLGATEWDWNADTLYLGGNPAGKNVTASQRDNCIYIGALGYITVDGITAQYGNEDNIKNYGNNVTIQNCDVKYAAYKGITTASLGVTPPANTIIYNNDISYNGLASADNSGSGVFAYKSGITAGNEAYVRSNDIHHNYGFGVYIWDNYWIIEKNHVYDNGNLVSTGANAIEIWDKDDDDAGGHNCIVRYNKVHGQISKTPDGTGICLDDYSSDNTVCGNISYLNDGPGIGLWRATDAVIYNNTTYGNNVNSSAEADRDSRPEIVADSDVDMVASNVKIKNNIGIATGTDEITWALYVGDKYVASTGLEITNNNWVSADTLLGYYTIGYNQTDIAGLNTATGGTDISADPKFKDAAGGKFWIKCSSPACSAGTDTTVCEQLLDPKSTFGVGGTVTTILQPQNHIPMGAYTGPKKSLFPVFPVFMGEVWCN